MKNFLHNIKMYIQRPPHGYSAPPGYTILPTQDLEELVRHFEALDATARAEDSGRHKENIRNHFADVIKELWHYNGRRADSIMFIFSDVLSRLTQEKLKEEHSNKVKTLRRTEFTTVKSSHPIDHAEIFTKKDK